MTASRGDRSGTLIVGGAEVEPGERLRFDLPAARLPTHTEMTIPLTILNGLRPGPRVWLSAAVHGDELNGVDVIRRVLTRIDEPLRRGALIAAPIVNVFGFIGQSRYFPDRRDLNRSFPGSRNGSLASRIAHLFMTEVVDQCTHGLDLHTAARDRTNLPQVRGDLDDPETLRIARAFKAPVMINSTMRSGSLRAAAAKRGAAVLVYEGGEALRFDERAISTGVVGVLGVLGELGLIRKRSGPRTEPRRVDRSTWVRARRGGLLRLSVAEGEQLRERQEIGIISDPFGDEVVHIKSPHEGLVIGCTRNPVVHAGDAIVHVGRVSREAEVRTEGA